MKKRGKMAMYRYRRRCHEIGQNAVHCSRETMQRLHEYGQRLVMEEQGWTVDNFRLEFGKNYLL